MENIEYEEKYQIISWLKVIDTALLRLIDSLKIGDDLILQDDKMILNFVPKIQNLFMSIILDTIESSTYFGKINILIGCCKPADNWRNIIQEKDDSALRLTIADPSLRIDETKLNQFLDGAFSKIRSGILQKTHKFHVYSNKILDQYDAVMASAEILSQFGSASYDPDSFLYHLILDGNHSYDHKVGLRREIIDDVKKDLIQIY